MAEGGAVGGTSSKSGLKSGVEPLSKSGLEPGRETGKEKPDPAVTGPVSLASLEWPPYAGGTLPGQGAAVEVVRQAFAAMGLEVEVTFLPWNRAIEASRNGRFDGYFPEYFSENLAGSFLFSSSIGASPLGFAEHADHPVHWERLDDLKGMTIGTVSGYVNTAQFDYMARSGELNVDPAPDDASNLRRIAAGRIPLAVIDRNVFESLRRRSGGPVDFSRLRFNPKLLEMKMLFLCLNRSERGEALLQILNEGLKQIDSRQITRRWYSRHAVFAGF